MVTDVFPNFNRTWRKDDVLVYRELNGQYPVIEDEFFMTGNRALSMLTIPKSFRINPLNLEQLQINTWLYNLTNPDLAPPGVDETNFRDIAFELLLGTYECEVRNVIGSDTATTIITECRCTYFNYHSHCGSCIGFF